MIARGSVAHLVLGSCCGAPLLPSEITTRVHKAQRRAQQSTAELLSPRATLHALWDLEDLGLLGIGHNLTLRSENVLDELGPWRPR